MKGGDRIHYRDSVVLKRGRDGWLFRVGCGLFVAESAIRTRPSMVTCANCRRSIWFRQRVAAIAKNKRPR